jgi:hypothetical protein
MALFTATPARRRLAMIALLLLAASGFVIRSFAENPSTLRDIGTLLLVLWLPAVGNLIGYFVKKVPHSAPPATDFAADAVFAPQLQARVEAVPAALHPGAVLDGEQRCTLLVGRHGFTARTEQPLAAMLPASGTRTLALELLHPKVALRKLAPGTQFHLLVRTTAVAKGEVTDVSHIRL